MVNCSRKLHHCQWIEFFKTNHVVKSEWFIKNVVFYRRGQDWSDVRCIIRKTSNRYSGLDAKKVWEKINKCWRNLKTGRAINKFWLFAVIHFCNQNGGQLFYFLVFDFPMTDSKPTCIINWIPTCCHVSQTAHDITQAQYRACCSESELTRIY